MIGDDLTLYVKQRDGEEYIWNNTNNEYSMVLLRILSYSEDYRRNESGISSGNLNSTTTQSLEVW